MGKDDKTQAEKEFFLEHGIYPIRTPTSNYVSRKKEEKLRKDLGPEWQGASSKVKGPAQPDAESFDGLYKDLEEKDPDTFYELKLRNDEDRSLS